MAAMIQQQTQSLPQPKDMSRSENDDVKLAKYINTKLQLGVRQPEVTIDTWSLPQPSTPMTRSVDWNQQQQPYQFNSMSAQPQISGNSATVHVTKSSSTPPKRSSQLLMQQQQQHYGRLQQQQQPHRKVNDRPPSLSSTTSSSAPSHSPSVDSARRDSVTSGTFSIHSSMTVNTRSSLSKRLRKVFSMNSLRSQPKGIVSEDSQQHRSPRRRSFAFFLKKDTTPASLTGHSKDRTLVTNELPMPTPSPPSTYSVPMSLSQQHEIHGLNMVPQVGIHYGLPIHASPRLRPAPAMSSTSSVNSMVNILERRRLYFSPTVQFHETFPAGEYDRRTDSSATCQKMTPVLAMRIKQELNEYKLTEMHVHADSRKFTQFFL